MKKPVPGSAANTDRRLRVIRMAVTRDGAKYSIGGREKKLRAADLDNAKGVA